MTLILQLVAIVALVGGAGSYVFATSDLFGGVRDRLDPLGTSMWVAFFADGRWRDLTLAKLVDLVTCAICLGWWANLAAVLWLSLVIDVQVGHWGWWPVIWLAACWVHTLILDWWANTTADDDA